MRYLAHAKQMQALDVIPEIADEFAQAFGRSSGGLLRRYRSEDAETVVVALGSVLGTIEEVVDELREQGVRIGAVGIKCFRPYPLDEVRDALAHASRVVVVERAFAVGLGGIVGQNVRLALAGLARCRLRRRRRARRPRDHEALAARAPRRRARRAGSSRTGSSSSTSTAGSSSASSQRLERERRSGPHAENILRDLGVVAARPH